VGNDHIVSKCAVALTADQLATANVCFQSQQKCKMSKCVEETPFNHQQQSSKSLNPVGFDSKQFDQLQCMTDQRVNLYVADSVAFDSTGIRIQGKPLHDINFANHTSWLHMSNSQQLDECLSRYLHCKNTAPAMTSAFIVKPSRLKADKHAAVFKHMRLLREYPAGTCLISNQPLKLAMQVWFMLNGTKSWQVSRCKDTIGAHRH